MVCIILCVDCIILTFQLHSQKKATERTAATIMREALM